MADVHITVPHTPFLGDIAPPSVMRNVEESGIFGLAALVFISGLALLRTPRRKLLLVSIPVGLANAAVAGFIASHSIDEHELPPARYLIAAILLGFLGIALLLRPLFGGRNSGKLGNAPPRNDDQHAGP